jgi:hypothetical protein
MLNIVRASMGTILSLLGGAVAFLLVGCKSMPALEQQEQLVQAENLVLDHITSRAVVNAWGGPPFIIASLAIFCDARFECHPSNTSGRRRGAEGMEGWGACRRRRLFCLSRPRLVAGLS